MFFLNVIGSATLFLPIPTAAIAFAAGGFLNPFLVGVVGAVGSAVGEMTGYFTGAGGKYVLGETKQTIKVEKWMKNYGAWAIFFLAVVPSPLFDIAGIIAGFTRFSLARFFLTTLAGKLIKFWAMSYLGHGSSLTLGKWGFF